MRKFVAICSLSLLALCGAATAKADTCSSSASNLVSNCGFETGTFAGWTGSSTTDTTGNYNGVSSDDPYQGTYAAYLGAFGVPTTLSQSLSTVAGQSYLVQFELDNTFSGSTSYPNSFAVDFGSSVLFAETNAVASGYQLYTLVGTATGAATTLSFVSSNDASYFDLDNVSVTATPEPSSLCLLGTGLVGAIGVARRRLRA